MPLFQTRRVRNAARLVAAPLVGRELGSPLRRGGALLVDLALLALFALPLAVVLGLAAAAVQVGGFDRLAALSAPADAAPAQLAERDEARRALVELFSKRRPAAVPEEVKQALAEGDDERLDAELEGLDFSLSVQLSSGQVESSWNAETGEVELANDVIFGRASRFVTIMAVIVGWFTLLFRVGNGRSPGKWVFGMRVVRADGRPLGWWTAFARAGAYLGSVGTFGLGFLEAVWEPNRQAAHDKAADTFVIRWPRRGSPPASAP